jgi:hypothetical protein
MLYVARKLARAGGSAMEARTVRHSGRAIGQWTHKRVEEASRWIRPSPIAQYAVGAVSESRCMVYLLATAYSLISIAKPSLHPHEPTFLTPAPTRTLSARTAPNRDSPRIRRSK